MNFLFTHTPLLYLTQSVWRDEAFSILLSQKPLLSFITDVTFEPPFYYILLHYWMKLFGTGEIAARSLSLLGFLGATVVIVFWAEKLFRKHWLAWFLPLFFFLNPELVYYAFEIRSYGWYMFFSVLSMFAYMERKIPLYIIATTLGLYTHTYMLIVPAVQFLHYMLTNKKKNLSDPLFRSFLIVGLLIAPWLFKVISDLHRLSQSWYFPVNTQLIKSVLGNIFLGYEGTPGYLWPFTANISLVLGIVSFFALSSPKTRNRNGFFFLLLFVPLVSIIGISFLKPLFVNRYVIPATIAEIFLVVFAIEHIKNKWIQKAAAATALLFVLGFNLWFPGKYAKPDIRSALYQINALAGPNDVILTDTPLILFETVYYSHNPNVYWYNPKGSAFPWYIGDLIFSPAQIIHDIPPYPTRAFLVHANGTFEISYNAPITAKP